MRFASAVIFGTLLLVLESSAADSTIGIRVRLQNYAGVSDPTLSSAKEDAAAILGRAGIRIDWAECRIAEGDAPKDAVCAMPITPLDLQIRVVNRDMAKRFAAKEHTLGYALLGDGFDSIAAVFFHRAVELERGNLASRSAILAAMLAHEIAHLLLERNNHSRTGIMRASWGDEDLKLIAKGRSGFTEEDSLQMAAMVAKRAAATVPNGAAVSE